MAKDLQFAEHTATLQDEDGDEYPHTVRAAVADKENYRRTVTNGDGERVKVPREVNVVGGGVRRLQPGDVIVETSKPGEYEVHTGDAWDKIGYKAADTSSPPALIPADPSGDNDGDRGDGDRGDGDNRDAGLGA